jgi:hypothetical protein
MLKHAHIYIDDGRVLPLNDANNVEDMVIDKETAVMPQPQQQSQPPPPQQQQQDLTFDFDQTSHLNVTEDTVFDEPIVSSTTKQYIPPITATTTTTMDPESIPEPIMDEERIPYTLPIEIFGEDTVACVLSIKAICRKRGLTQIEQHIIQQANQDVVHATLLMMQEAVMDSREVIVCQAMDVWHQTHHIGELADMSYMERAFGGLLKRTSDSNVNIRQTATELALVLVQDYPLMPYFICKPERIIHNHKEAKARVQLVETTVSKLQVPLQDVMSFVVVYLKHVHEDVRQAAVKLLVTISDQFGFNQVSSYIDESLRLSLADSVTKLVDKDPFFKKGSATKDTLTELRALTVAQPEKKTITRVKKSAVSSTKDRKSTTTTTTSTTNNSTKSVKKPASATTRSAAKSTTTTAAASREKQKTKPISAPAPVAVKEEELNENSICIFCDEVNPEFNEDTLIKHYYNTCPVLTNCPMCQIVSIGNTFLA